MPLTPGLVAKPTAPGLLRKKESEGGSSRPRVSPSLSMRFGLSLAVGTRVGPGAVPNWYGCFNFERVWCGATCGIENRWVRSLSLLGPASSSGLGSRKVDGSRVAAAYQHAHALG